MGDDSDADREAKVLELYEQGLTCRQIELATGVSKSSVSRLAKRLGMARGRDGGRRKGCTLPGDQAKDCAVRWHEVVSQQHGIAMVCGKEAAEFAEAYALIWVQWWCYLHGIQAPDSLPQLTDYIEP